MERGAETKVLRERGEGGTSVKPYSRTHPPTHRAHGGKILQSSMC